MKVRVLPDHVVNQIAAGEVVDRPSSVVRELIDNAVDAGASEITIAIEGGGRSLIRVVDNGCGMSRDDAVLAFERHATSKVREITDLDSVETMGFRGEALPAIASVAKVTLRSRIASQDLASEVVLEGGRLRDVKSVPGAVGTEVVVRQLFYNTPARRKFLKSDRVEELRVKQWLLQSMVAHPEIRVRLFADERDILNLPRRPSSAERVRTLLGTSGVALLLERNSIRLEGMLAHPGAALPAVHALAILINNRLVGDRVVMRAVKEAFGAVLKDREYPVGYLALFVPPRDVDVNVHPQKSEVRFRNPSEVFELVRSAVASAIGQFRAPVRPESAHVWTPGLAPSHLSNWQSKVAAPVANSEFCTETRETPFADQALIVEQEPQTIDSLVPPEIENKTFKFSELRFLGQLFQCYLLCEWRGELCVVDMHAAHERIHYNHVRAGLRNRLATGLPSQALLIPARVTVGELGVEILRPVDPLLTAVGFALSYDEVPGEVLVSRVPALLADKNYAAVLREIAQEDSEIESTLSAFERMLDRIAARIACHASVRSGKKLASEEVEQLFRSLDSESCSAACPHGRPVVVRIAEREVEQWFGRDA